MSAAGVRHRSRRGPGHDSESEEATGVVAIVGRPNVGKSTLFNRLTGTRRAIVDELAGLTRDRLYGLVEWRGRTFTLVDTAGLDPKQRSEHEDLDALIRGTQAQARMAIEEADVCLLMVDVRDGVTPIDEEIAALLRRGGKPVVLVGNKADSQRDPYYAHELHGLGLGQPMLISALQGKDTGDLLDLVVAALPPAPEGETFGVAADELRLAILGRPNTGKSSLLNALVGEERTLVSPVAGTTRDTVDTLITFGGRRIRLVDTAGIRRRGVVETDVERFSLLRALRALQRSDVGLLVVDAAQGVVAQDRHVAGYASEAGAGLVVAANKWDLVPQHERADPGFLKAFSEAFEFVPGTPVLTLSATEGRNVQRVLPAVLQVADARAVHVATGPLNALLRDAVDEHPPRTHKGRRLKLFFAAQARTRVPTIVLFVNDPELLHFAYQRYLENRIRAVFGFGGVRLRILARRRDGEDS